MSNFLLTESQILVQECSDRFYDESCGAFVTFEGRVRNLHQGKQVKSLYYEAYSEMALKQGERVLADALQGFDIASAFCVHRLGLLELGDLAVWVGVNSGHREAAFAASRFIIDEIKKEVPIWKKEHYVASHDGTLHEDSLWLHPQN